MPITHDVLETHTRVTLVFPWPDGAQAVQVFFNGRKLWPTIEFDLDETLDGDAAIEFSFDSQARPTADRVELTFDTFESLYFERVRNGWGQVDLPRRAELG